MTKSLAPLALLVALASATKTKEYPDMPKAKTAEAFAEQISKAEAQEAGTMEDDNNQMMADSTAFLEQFIQNDALHQEEINREVEREVKKGEALKSWIERVDRDGYDTVNGQKVYMLDVPQMPPDTIPEKDNAKWYKDMMLDPMLHGALQYNKKEEAAALIERGNKQNRVETMRASLKAAPGAFHKALLLWKELSKEHYGLLLDSESEKSETKAQQVLERAAAAQKQLNTALKGTSNPQSLIAVAQNSITAGLVQSATKNSGLPAGMGALQECAKEGAIPNTQVSEAVLAQERCLCMSSAVCRMAEAPGLCGTFLQTTCFDRSEL